MTTSEEHAERLGYYPATDVYPRPHSVNGITQAGGPMPPPIPAPQPGDPGPQPPPASLEPVTDADVERLRKASADLEIIMRSLKFELAAVSMIKAYGDLTIGMARAAAYFDPSIWDGKDGLRQELSDALMTMERALHPQVQREAAE